MVEQNILRYFNLIGQGLNPNTGFIIVEDSGPSHPGWMNMKDGGPMRTGKTVPAVYKQPQPQTQAMLTGGKTQFLPSSGNVPLLTTSGKPLPQQSTKSVNTLGERTGYVLKDGTVVGKNTLNLINEAQKKTKIAQKKMMSGTAAVGILGALEAIPYAQRRAMLDKISNDPRLTYDQRSLIEGLKTKELINSYIGGVGAGAVTGASSVAGHPYIGATASAPLTQGLIKINDKLWNAGLKKGLRDNFTEEDIKALLFGDYKNKGANVKGAKEDTSNTNNGNSTKAKAQAVVNAVANSQPQGQQVLKGGVTEEATPDEVSTILQQASDRNAPYIKALEQYLANYPRLLDQSARNNLYFYGANLAKGLNPKAGEMFNQVKNYENMVGIVKAIEDAKNATTDYTNEVAGNMEVAKNLDGLSPQAAFANKNLLTAYSMRERDKVKQAIADANNLVRRYGINKRAAMQLAIQNLRNENALAVAAMYSGMGYPGVGLTSTGQSQSTSVAPVQYPQQQPMSQEESVYSQIKRNRQ